MHKAFFAILALPADPFVPRSEVEDRIGKSDYPYKLRVTLVPNEEAESSAKTI